MHASMSTNPLFTVGHSARDIGDFNALLAENGVTAVADVRSSPYSRHFPHFNRDELKDSLRNRQIHYVFLGEELGARRAESECYVDDIAKYELIAQTGAFARGLDRLRRGIESHRIALLCAEKDPLTCHRAILVCRQFREEFSIVHIIDHGVVEEQAALETRLLKLTGLPERALFDDRDAYIAEAYEKQGKEIAYRREALASANAQKEG